jgi:type IV fimbrial biogenesis protein FimT
MNSTQPTRTSRRPTLQGRPGDRRGQRQQRGASLVELCMVLVVVALSLGTALPSFQAARLARHLDGAAAQLETDIQLTRSRAVAERRNLRMSFFQDLHGSCYVVHSGDADSCSCNAQGEAVCTANATAARSVRYPAAHPVKLHTNVRSIVFGANQGTSTPTGTLKFQTSPTHAVHAVVNVMGRVRHCAPATATAVRGYPKC